MNGSFDLQLALVGNPNSGKTTIFNALTGSHQHVGNWPGKTVERKLGLLHLNGLTLSVLDLPGTYSLTAYSEEECIARDALLDTPPDLVLVVLDACNLERHLYLALQVLETGHSVILALNMTDLADKNGERIDPVELSKALGGVPVVALSAKYGTGMEDLKAEIERQALQLTAGEAAPGQDFSLDYGSKIEAELLSIGELVQDQIGVCKQQTARWLALKLLEGEHGVEARIAADAGSQKLLEAATASQDRLECSLGSDVHLAIADRRYQFAGQAAQRALKEHSGDSKSESLSDRLDRALTHPVLGVLFFLLVMYIVFSLVVEVSSPFLDWISAFFAGPLSSWTAWGLARLGAPEWLRGLMLEGLIDGVGGVLVFLPGLIVLFAFLALLEDSGYMARAAFVMNRTLSWMGLNGKSFVPLVLGFGCAVPAVYATRTLERQRDRILTALLIPFMSCSARLPVYVVFALALFGRQANLVIWGLYALGVTFAAGAGWVLSRTLLRSGEPSSFIMELPTYRWPSPRDTARMVRRRTTSFLRNAGTVILGASIAIWLLLNLPTDAENLESTYFGGVSKALAPVFKPAGFGTWQASGSLVSGLVAKEVVVATMSQIFLGQESVTVTPERLDLASDLLASGKSLLRAAGDAGYRLLRTFSFGLLPIPGGSNRSSGQLALGRILSGEFSRPAALAFLVYVLLYIPCVATLSALRAEFGMRWALFSAAYQSLVAWVTAVGVFQLARLLMSA